MVVHTEDQSGRAANTIPVLYTAIQLEEVTMEMVVEIIKVTLVNSSPPGQNGRHFADDIFKRIFLNENGWILN